MSVIDDYLANVPKAERAELQRIREIVHAAVPEAEEVISYRIPAFKLHGQYLVGFNAFRDHLSLFPASEPTEVLKDKLRDYTLSRGTIRFTLDQPLPEALIKELVLIRARAIAR